MSDLSEQDQFFLNVGRCLTAWNRVEANILQILEYACSRNGLVGPEFRIGYWSVVSFSARLRWCNSVVKHRLKDAKYEALAARWQKLQKHTDAKSHERAEVAHGSVVTLVKGSDTGNKRVALIPFLNREMDHMIAKLPMKDADFFAEVRQLNLSEIVLRTKSFKELSQDLSKFITDWMLVDARPVDQGGDQGALGAILRRPARRAKRAS